MQLASHLWPIACHFLDLTLLTWHWAVNLPEREIILQQYCNLILLLFVILQLKSVLKGFLSDFENRLKAWNLRVE